MSRMALIKDGKVVNIIEGGPNYNPPDGHAMVPANDARIGDGHDGVNVVAKQKPTAAELVAHLRARYRDVPNFPVRVGDVVVNVEHNDASVIANLARRAEKDQSVAMLMPQPRSVKEPLRLDAKQVVALNEAITDFHVAQHRAYGAVYEGIASGKITGHDQIDYPPAPMPQWPARYDETPK